tara:strand:+ start:371 stop:988 length:618 start_codon:yes stop_codon:yes gene_type:complete
MKYKTEQENFWNGEFAKGYIDRNKGNAMLASNINLFTNVLSKCGSIKSCLELGSNIGMNLKALISILPNTNFSAVEINKSAVTELEKFLDKDSIFHESILNWNTKDKYDLVFTKGVLIHINPEHLSNVYEKIYKSSQKYILICEYYNPSPQMVIYRGEKNKLFKRDFAGDILKKYKDLSLIDYGFVYRNDNLFPMDDINWFLLKK